MYTFHCIINKMSNQVCIGQLMFLYFILFYFYQLSNVFHNFLNLYLITKMSCFIKLYFITIMSFMSFIVEDNNFRSRNVCNMCLHVRKADSFVMMTDGVSPDIQTLLYMPHVLFSLIFSFILSSHSLYFIKFLSSVIITYIITASSLSHMSHTFCVSLL